MGDGPAHDGRFFTADYLSFCRCCVVGRLCEQILPALADDQGTELAHLSACGLGLLTRYRS